MVCKRMNTNNTKGQNKNDINSRGANSSDGTGDAEVGYRSVGNVLVDNSDGTGDAELGNRAVGNVLVDKVSELKVLELNGGGAKSYKPSEFPKLEVAGGAVLRHPDNIMRAIGVKVFYSQLGETKVKEVYVDQHGNVSLNPDNFCPLRKVINLLDN